MGLVHDDPRNRALHRLSLGRRAAARDQPRPWNPVVSGDEQVRIGTDEREQAVSALADHHAAGRLDADEYEDRRGRAGDAVTRRDFDGSQGLLHVEVGAFERVSLQAYNSGDTDTVRRHFAFADDALDGADAALVNALHVSYAERFAWGAAHEQNAKSLMPPASLPRLMRCETTCVLAPRGLHNALLRPTAWPSSLPGGGAASTFACLQAQRLAGA